MSRLIAALVALLSLMASPIASAHEAPASGPQELFREGNEAYFQGDYEMAARLYGRILEEHELEDPVLYHNLGNAWFRTGAYGSAILYYRRGLRLGPDDELAAALRRNLEVTRRALQERYRTGSDRSEFIYAEPGGVLYRLTHLASPFALTLAFLGCWWLLWGLVILRRARPDRGGYGAAAVPVAVLAVLFGLLLAGRVWTDDHFRLGVVVDDRVTLREGRHTDAHGIDIPEGMEVRIVEGGSDWTRVELANGRDGWVETGSVKQI